MRSCQIEHLCLLLLLLAGGGRARAAGDDAAFQQHYRAAEASYLDQRYAAAVVEFKQAYAIRPAPLLLINIGKAYLKLGKPTEALSYFDQFDKAVPRPSAEVKARLAAVRAQATAQLSAQPAVPPPQEPKSAVARLGEPVPLRVITALEAEPLQIELKNEWLTTLAATQQAARCTTPCATSHYPGPALLQVHGPSGFLTRVTIPGQAATLEIRRQRGGFRKGGIGLLGSGVGVGLVGAILLTVGSNSDSSNTMNMTRTPLQIAGGAMLGAGVLMAAGGLFLWSAAGSDRVVVLPADAAPHNASQGPTLGLSALALRF